MLATRTAVQLVVVAATVVGLWIGARLLVESVIRLARRLGLSELTIGLTVVAAGTSTPELAVTADAAWRGLGDIAVGNVVGSSIYNLAFILGVVSLVRFVPVERSLVHRDGIVLIASALLAGVVLFDGTVSRPEGVVLVGLLVAYTTYLLRTGAEEAGDAPSTNGGTAVPTVTDAVAFRGRDAVLVVVGLAVVLVSSDRLVETAAALARGAGVSEWVIGGTIVAAGTSTPEFAVSLIAVRRGRLGVSVGNVVGSNVFNLLGILGVAATLRPLTVAAAALDAVAWLTVVSVVMVGALWTGRRLSRVEGGLFTLSEVVRWAWGLLG